MSSKTFKQQAEKLKANNYTAKNAKLLVDSLDEDILFELKKIGYYSDYELFFTLETVNKILSTVIMVQKLKIEMLNDSRFFENKISLTIIEDSVYFNLNAFEYTVNSVKTIPINLFMLDVYSFGKTFTVNKEIFFPLYIANSIKEILSKNFLSISKKDTLKTRKTYLIKDGNSGFYKIGYSSKPELRETTLHAELPLVDILFYCDGFIENELHKKYKHLRVRGEWFALTDDCVIEIYNRMSAEPNFTLIKNNNI